MMAHQNKNKNKFHGEKMQKFIVTYANNQSFTIEATSHADYVAKVKAKFFSIYLQTGRDYSKSAYSEAI